MIRTRWLRGGAAGLALAASTLAAQAEATAASERDLLGGKAAGGAACTVSSPRCQCRALDKEWWRDFARGPVTREALRRRYPNVLFVIVRVPVDEEKLEGRVVWVDPRVDEKVLICDGATVKVAVGKYDPGPVCNNVDVVGRSLSEALDMVAANKLDSRRILLPESMHDPFTLQVRAQSPRFDEKPKVACSTPITIVAQPKAPRDPVRAIVGEEALALDEHGQRWKLCDGAAGLGEPGKCPRPPASNVVVSQWPAPGEWAERPGEIVVFTRSGTLAPADDEPLMPTVPLLAVPIAIAGYEVLRRLRPRNDPAGDIPPADLGTPREGITVRGQVDRP